MTVLVAVEMMCLALSLGLFSLFSRLPCSAALAVAAADIACCWCHSTFTAVVLVRAVAVPPAIFTPRMPGVLGAAASLFPCSVAVFFFMLRMRRSFRTCCFHRFLVLLWSVLTVLQQHISAWLSVARGHLLGCPVAPMDCSSSKGARC